MRIEELKNPGTYSGGQQLRARIAHAISFAETVQRYRSGGGTSPTAKAIADLLLDAAQKTPGYTAPLPPSGTATLANAATVTVLPATGTTPAQGSATAAVTGNTLSGIRLAATAAVVTNSSTVPVQNSAGAAIGTGTRTVAANAVTNVRLPATVAGVTNGTAVTCTVTGTYVNKFTPTVANGVITGIVLG